MYIIPKYILRESMKVLCKEDYDNKFFKNKYYEVFIEFENSYWIYGEDIEGFKDVHNFLKSGVGYTGDKNFNNYFDTLRISRKKKLDKIKSIQNESTL